MNNKVSRQAGLMLLVLMAAAPAGAGDLTRGVTLRPAAGFTHIQARNAAGALVNAGTAVAVTPDRLATACHILAGASRLTTGRGQELEHVTQHPKADLCLLRPISDMSLVPVTRRPERLAPGQAIRIVGQPTAHTETQIQTAATEAVAEAGTNEGSATRSQGRVHGLAHVAGVPLILTDAPLPRGLSGGAVIDERGRLAGLAVGRWPWAGLSVAVDLTRLDPPPKGAASPISGIETLPPFLDADRNWPEILAALWRLQPPASEIHPAQARLGPWFVTRHPPGCALRRRGRQIDLSLAIRPGAVRARLSVPRVPLTRAGAPLTVRLLPADSAFRFAALRLNRQGGPDTAPLWTAQWRLTGPRARAFLAALPRAEGLVAESEGPPAGSVRTLGAVTLPALDGTALLRLCAP